MAQNENNLPSISRTSADNTSRIATRPSTESCITNIGFPSAPDGGWGWMVVLASFIISAICDGIAFSFGIFYIELLEAFDESKSMTSWVGSVFVGTPLICGPLASALVTKFGCRTMTIVGGLISSTGFILSYFGNSIGMLCFLLGIISGLGMSFCYVTSVIIVAFYFERKRALATGLSVCGTGAGTFLCAPFVELLISMYGWRGTVLILGGLTLNIVACGCLYRPLKFTRCELEKRKQDVLRKSDTTPQCGPQVDRKKDLDNKTDIDQTSQSVVQLPTYTGRDQANQISQAVVTHVRKNSNYLEQDLRKMIHHMTFAQDLEQKKAAVGPLLVTSDDKIVIADKKEQTVSLDKQIHLQLPEESLLRYVVDYMPLFRKDVFYRGNVVKLLEAQRRTSSCPEFYSRRLDGAITTDKKDELVIGFYQVLRNVVLAMFDWNIMCNPLFILYSLSNFILYLWYDVPYLFIGVRATGLGISKGKASLIISLIGLVNTIGQILYGYIGDKPVNLTLLYATSSIVLGLSVFIVPLYDTYLYMCFASAIFGFFVSCNYALTTVILVHYLGLDKLTNACGLLMLIQGIANLFGPPLAGYLSDITGNYDVSFYSAGFCIVISGCIMFLVPYLSTTHH